MRFEQKVVFQAPFFAGDWFAFVEATCLNIHIHEGGNLLFCFFLEKNNKFLSVYLWLDEVSSDTSNHTFSMFSQTFKAGGFYQSTQPHSSIEPHQQNLSLQSFLKRLTASFSNSHECHKLFSIRTNLLEGQRFSPFIQPL